MGAPRARRRAASLGSEDRRLTLLNATLAHAALHSPFYRERLRGLALPLSATADLGQVEVLSRQELETAGQSLLAQDRVPVTVAMTSGSTRPKPLITFRSASEGAARSALLSGLPSGEVGRPLLMHLVNSGHGFDVDAPIKGCFQVPLERWFHFEAVLELLEANFAFPGFGARVQGLAGALRLLKALTMLCLENDIDPTRFEIRLVSSSSDHLTRRWRRLLVDYWGTPVDDVYGLSEVPGLYARRCVSCGHFHFSSLALVETVSLDRDAPASGRIGRVVATSLYPLAAMQPIIRYDTGDVIQWATDPCRLHGAPGFELPGRRSQLVVAPSAGSSPGEVLLPSVVLNDVLDAVPDIAVSEYGFTRGLGIRASIGLQKWGLRQSVEAGVVGVGLEVELRWSPRQHPAEAEELRGRLRREILDSAPAFSRALDERRATLEVSLLEPGSGNLWALV